MAKLEESILNELKESIGPENVREQEPMCRHLTMEVGGPADYFFTPRTPQAVARVLAALKESGVPYYILGNGSNVIVRDEGYRGAVVNLLENMDSIAADGDLVYAQAGATLKHISDVAEESSLTGFEFASGIPGTIGGAVSMNAGAYDGEMKDVIESVTVLDGHGDIQVIPAEEMDFSYRHSVITDRGYVVLSAAIRLAKGDRASIRAKVEDLTARRQEKQPLEYPSCGSTFKRPAGYFAGKLIMDSGLRGTMVGGAQVSEKHCGFVINKDHATAADVLDLIALVQKTVKEKQGVSLECEVKIL